jgi:cation:H+ antiporter
VTSVVAFAGGLIGLLAAGHLVVRAASALGGRFGLSPNIIGLTIVAAGTSAPELAVVFQAIAADDTELAVGSIIGSNIANILLVLGLASLMGAITVASRLVRVDIPVMMLASAGLVLFALDRNLGQLEGLLLVVGLVAFTIWTLGTAANGTTPDPARREVDLVRTVGGLVAGIIVLAVAARFVVIGAEDIAAALGVPELIIGLTIVALGTSAPEIVTTLVAAAQGHRDLAVGNAVGSNIYNILLVLGLTSAVTPAGIAISADAVTLDLPIMAAVAFACLPLVAWDRRLARWEGAVFLTYYLAYLTFLVLDATGHRAKDPFALVMVAFVLPLTIITIATVLYRRHLTSRPSRLSTRHHSPRAPSKEVVCCSSPAPLPIPIASGGKGGTPTARALPGPHGRPPAWPGGGRAAQPGQQHE